jgi:hypothetical protein
MIVFFSVLFDGMSDVVLLEDSPISAITLFIATGIASPALESYLAEGLGDRVLISQPATHPPSIRPFIFSKLLIESLNGLQRM